MDTPRDFGLDPFPDRCHRCGGKLRKVAWRRAVVDENEIRLPVYAPCDCDGSPLPFEES
jgi:hypothetical protein